MVKAKDKEKHFRFFKKKSWPPWVWIYILTRFPNACDSHPNAIYYYTANYR